MKDERTHHMHGAMDKFILIGTTDLYNILYCEKKIGPILLPLVGLMASAGRLADKIQVGLEILKFSTV